MTELLDTIQTLLTSETRDLEAIERTLTDGYAEALSLEAERWRLERRMAEVTHGIERGDTTQKARELATLAQRLEMNVGDLAALRSVLARLRAHADDVRVENPVG